MGNSGWKLRCASSGLVAVSLLGTNPKVVSEFKRSPKPTELDVLAWTSLKSADVSIPSQRVEKSLLSLKIEAKGSGRRSDEAVEVSSLYKRTLSFAAVG